jgi:hypothetical protein
VQSSLRTVNSQWLLDLLYHRPVVSVSAVAEHPDITFNAAKSLVAELCDLGLLREATGGARRRPFAYERSTARQWAGIALSVAGIAALALLGGDGAGGSGTGGGVTGHVLVLAAGLSQTKACAALLIERDKPWQNGHGESPGAG